MHYVLNEVVDIVCHEQEAAFLFVDVRDSKDEVAKIFYHEEEACANAIHMSKEILDTEDDNACVKISNLIHF
jgi:hypothetical protein